MKKCEERAASIFKTEVTLNNVRNPNTVSIGFSNVGYSATLFHFLLLSIDHKHKFVFALAGKLDFEQPS